MAKKDIYEAIVNETPAVNKPATVTVVSPTDPLNPKDDKVPVRADSLREHYEMEIKRGVPTEVPIAVYDILSEAGYITGKA